MKLTNGIEKSLVDYAVKENDNIEVGDSIIKEKGKVYFFHFKKDKQGIYFLNDKKSRYLDN